MQKKGTAVLAIVEEGRTLSGREGSKFQQTENSSAEAQTQGVWKS